MGFGLWAENVRFFAKIISDMYQWKPVELSKLQVFVSRKFFEELCYFWRENFLLICSGSEWTLIGLLLRKRSSGLLKLYWTCGEEIFRKNILLCWKNTFIKSFCLAATFFSVLVKLVNISTYRQEVFSRSNTRHEDKKDFGECFLTVSEKWSDSWWNKFWQGCQDCIQSVQNVNLKRNEFFERMITFDQMENEAKSMNLWQTVISRVNKIVPGYLLRK